MILTVTLNPCIDHAIFVSELKLGDTNRVVRKDTDIGGKGINVSRIVSELGGKTIASGFLAGPTGEFIQTQLGIGPVDPRFVWVEGDTRVNFSVEDDSQRPPTSFNERGPYVSASSQAELLSLLGQLASEATFACIGGSSPPGVEPSYIADLVSIMKSNGAKVVLDADGEPMKKGLLAHPFMIKPNAKEAERVVGYPVQTLDDALRAASDLVSGHASPELVVISRGADGAVMACPEGVYWSAAPEVQVKSTVGAGDSMVGGIVWALENGRGYQDAFKVGVAAGSATSTTDGSCIATKAQIEQLIPLVQVHAS